MRVRRTLSLFGLFAAVAIALAACGAPTVSDLTGSGRTPLPPTPTPTAGRHHPVGFADPAQHGPYAKFSTENCTACHGANLDGVGQPTAAYPDLPANGCDTCHAAGWKTNCTFCHGGQDNDTGAPARDITELAGQITPNPIFKAHTQHVTASTVHVAFDCIQCHAAKPTDALSSGHWLTDDSTPGFAEVSFPTGSLSVGGTYGAAGSGQCNNIYCHGTGRNGATGSVNQSAGAMTCHSCHGYSDNATSMQTMTSNHRRSDHRVACVLCHSATIDANGNIVDATMHVNKKRDVKFSGDAAGVTFNNGRCTGSCHGKNHNENW